MREERVPSAYIKGVYEGYLFSGFIDTIQGVYDKVELTNNDGVCKLPHVFEYEMKTLNSKFDVRIRSMQINNKNVKRPKKGVTPEENDTTVPKRTNSPTQTSF